MTRTYLDFDTVADALDGLIQIYEHSLKNESNHFNYTLNELSDYIDKIADLTCLVYNDI